MKKLYVIYIPGIGDDMPTGQRWAVNTWKLWGVKSELFQMVWSDKRPWEAKLKLLLARIDELNRAGYKVALVGASAGASAVINAYAERSDVVAGVVVIAGKINNPQSIGDRYRQNNPSFVASAEQCPKSLATLNDEVRQRILSRYGRFDELIPARDSQIKGAKNQTVFMAGHALVIATQILYGAPGFLRFLKRIAK